MAGVERVEFRADDGTVLRGDLYKAEGEGVPAVVLTNGITVLRSLHLDVFGKAFQAAGISAVAYDHRSVGASDGMPRYHADPHRHAEDYHDAVIAAGRLPGIDPDRIALFGIGHGGGWAMMAAAEETRAKAAILQRPIHSGRATESILPAGLLQRALDERLLATEMDADPEYIKIWPDSLANARGEEGEPAMLGNEIAYGLRQSILQKVDETGLPWQSRLTLASVYNLVRAEPSDFVKRITIPTLYLIGEDDPFTGDVDLEHAIAAQSDSVEFVASSGSLDTLDHQNAVFAEEAQIHIEFLRRVL